MEKLNVSKAVEIVKAVGGSAKEHLPTVMAVAGVCGFTYAGVDAVKHTPEAMSKLEEAKTRYNTEELTFLQKVDATWKCYTRPVLVGIASGASVLVGNHLSVVEKAGLLATIAMGDKKLSQYMKAVSEAAPDKVKEVADRFKESNRKDFESGAQVCVVGTSQGNVMYYEPISGRFFRSNDMAVMRATMSFTSTIGDDGYASVNTWFAALGLDGILIGEYYGWNNSPCVFGISLTDEPPMEAPDGSRAFVITYRHEPSPDFDGCGAYRLAHD